ncbi:6-bisphosphate aldolase) [Durusdinium trenchii]|uniref:fructose-bisphosphate aldolase n=1 Tax=Durusdinium trenchii TaxID=1381693 RepID=A0ABP0S089_9DINO
MAMSAVAFTNVAVTPTAQAPKALAARTTQPGQGDEARQGPTLMKLSSGLALGALACRRSMRTSRKAQAIDEKRFPVLSRSEAPLGVFPKMPKTVHPGVVTGQALKDLLNHAKENGYAIPAVNCVSSSSINACIEAARKMDAPIMIQFSAGGAQFYAGKGLDNTQFHAAIAGAVSGAYHVRAVAEQYGVPVILHTDHCAKKLLPWFDGLMEANERFFEQQGEPLFSSHMLDLSEEPLEENIEICVKYLERMAKFNCGLEMELGITGGEEDGVNNEDANPEDLYSKPEEILQVYDALSKVDNGFFTVAAAFGNVHGVYQPGNVRLEPKILDRAQKYIAEKVGMEEGSKPVSFVFHGGSGSDLKDIREAVGYGVIKMNIDTDTQWSYWSGIKDFETKYHDYLQTQIGNPDGEDKPNKKYYDPRACIRSAEESTVQRMEQCFEDLRCVNVLGLGPPAPPSNVMGPRRGGLPA